jgi:hypothetical protein
MAAPNEDMLDVGKKDEEKVGEQAKKATEKVEQEAKPLTAEEGERLTSS